MFSQQHSSRSEIYNIFHFFEKDYSRYICSLTREQLDLKNYRIYFRQSIT